MVALTSEGQDLPLFHFVALFKLGFATILMAVGIAGAADRLQEHDSTCGAAALLYLLQASGNVKITEADILTEAQTLFGYQLGKDDFSVAQIELLATRFGFLAKAAKIPFESVSKLRQPIVVLLSDKQKKIKHFTVLEKVRDDVVYMFDPTLGPVRVSMDDLKVMSADPTGVGLISVGVKSNMPGGAFYPPVDRLSQDAVDSTYNPYRRAMLIAKNRPLNRNQVGVEYGYTLQDIVRPIQAKASTSSLGLRYGVGDDAEFLLGYSKTKGSIYSGAQRSLIKSEGVSMSFNKLISSRGGNYSNTLSFGVSADTDGGVLVSASGVIVGTFNSFEGFSSADFSYQKLSSQMQASVAVGANIPVSDYLMLTGSLSSKRVVANQVFGSEIVNAAGASATYLVSKRFQISCFAQKGFRAVSSSSFGMSISYLGGW